MITICQSDSLAKKPIHTGKYKYTQTHTYAHTRTDTHTYVRKCTYKKYIHTNMYQCCFCRVYSAQPYITLHEQPISHVQSYNMVHWQIKTRNRWCVLHLTYSDSASFSFPISRRASAKSCRVREGFLSNMFRMPFRHSSSLWLLFKISCMRSLFISRASLLSVSSGAPRVSQT